MDILKYLFAPEGFLWPYNLFYALLAVVSWLWFTPGLDRTAHFQVGVDCRNLRSATPCS